MHKCTAERHSQAQQPFRPPRRLCFSIYLVFFLDLSENWRIVASKYISLLVDSGAQNRQWARAVALADCLLRDLWLTS